MRSVFCMMIEKSDSPFPRFVPPRPGQHEYAISALMFYRLLYFEIHDSLLNIRYFLMSNIEQGIPNDEI